MYTHLHMSLSLIPIIKRFIIDVIIERAFVRVPSPLFGDRIFGIARVTRKILRIDLTKDPKLMYCLHHAEVGRSDAVNTINDFVFTPVSRSAFENLATIVDDDVLEFDEIFIAEFSFGPEIANNWNGRKGEPIAAFILIRDDDCELFSDYAMTVQT